MPKAARLGDMCTGHGCFPGRPNIQGEPTVLINNLPAHRVSHAWDTHCHPCGVSSSCHGSVLAGGSSSVFIGGNAAGRIGDPVACGSAVATGSPNVIIGG